MSLHSLSGIHDIFELVGRQVVHHHNIFASQRWSRHLFDVGHRISPSVHRENNRNHCSIQHTTKTISWFGESAYRAQHRRRADCWQHGQGGASLYLHHIHRGKLACCHPGSVGSFPLFSSISHIISLLLRCKWRFFTHQAQFLGIMAAISLPCLRLLAFLSIFLIGFLRAHLYDPLPHLF